MKSPNIPLVELPHEIELILLLIKEELKSHKFFGVLRSVGLDDAYFQSDLSAVILTYVGLADESNETMDFYFDLLDTYSQKIEADNVSVMKQALNFYIDLVEEKRRRCEEQKKT